MNVHSDKKRKFVIAVAMLLFAGAIFFVLSLRSNEPVIINEDRINIYLHETGSYYITARLRGGYEVCFADIAEIALLPYSASQLGNMIESLDVPALRTGYSPQFGTSLFTASYVSRRNYRIHVSLFPDAAPTIWITRYENVPVLLSFRYAYQTEALYVQIVTAWEQWQITGQ